LRQEWVLGLIHQSPNHFLASLPRAAFELLRRHFRDAELVHETVLAKIDETLAHAYFPFSGVISVIVSLAGGEIVEVAMIGRDSVFGATAALDGRAALNDAMVQMPGLAARLG
jgi:hypothetical protein